jgi:prepilin-type N-terminal cleavage/methylation domain-containing protein
MVTREEKVRTGISPTGNPRIRRASGFTLLELLVVLAILGIFLGMFSLRTGGIVSEGDLRLASRMIIAQVGYFRGKAASTRSEQFLFFNIDKDRLEKEIADGETGSETFQNRREIILQLPKGVDLVDISVERRGKFQEGDVSIRFSPNGCLERTLVHMRNAENEIYTIEFNPLTGQATLHDSYVDQKEAF